MLDGATLNPGDNPWGPLASLGALTVHARTSPQQVVDRARGARVVLTNKTVLTRQALEQLPDLRLICVLATGVNVVDLDAADSAGVTVCNVPDYSSESVAQHVFALLLHETNAVALHGQAARDGEWSGGPDFSLCKRPLMELAGRTLGIVGYGRIGATVGRIAHAFGMQVLGFSPSRSAVVPLERFRWSGIEEIFALADVVSLHCPLTSENAGFVDSRRLSTMREGSILVNTARGGLVDEAALVAALDSGRPGLAALDVLCVEPPAADHPLVLHPRCVVTPHVAWATLAARRRLMEITAQNICCYAAGCPQNVVVATHSSAMEKGKVPR